MFVGSKIREKSPIKPQSVTPNKNRPAKPYQAPIIPAESKSPVKIGSTSPGKVKKY